MSIIIASVGSVAIFHAGPFNKLHFRIRYKREAMPHFFFQRLIKLKLLLRLIIADYVHIGIQIFQFIHILMQLDQLLLTESSGVCGDKEEDTWLVLRKGNFLAAMVL